MNTDRRLFADDRRPRTDVFFMPHIQVTLLKGRTTEQKRKLAKRLTDAMVEEAGATRDGVTVVLVEVEKEDFARGGTLIVDRK
ncbi:MAG TPA: 2-hydroxymuconate tautomerase [Terriglobales bacterium]|jgi:4-oxalocrotonate tautomerase|nr:2-hydroxymuconate tautomerase [Terriglobales bacterium]